MSKHEPQQKILKRSVTYAHQVTALFQTIYVHMGDEDEGMIS
jgi:hypothetical protein